MNPELEALIKAYLALGECDLRRRQRRQAEYNALLEEALQMSLASRVKCLLKGFAAAPSHS
jgi:hypothetical protein